MPRPDITPSALEELTDLQLAILSALWAAPDSSIADVHAVASRRTEVALKTVATLLSRLEQRKLVTRRTLGREGLFTARVTRRQVLMSRAHAMLSALFPTDEQAVGAAAVRRRDVKKGDTERMLELLRQAEEDLK